MHLKFCIDNIFPNANPNIFEMHRSVKHHPYQMESMSNSFGLVRLLGLVGQVKFLGTKNFQDITLQTFICHSLALSLILIERALL